MISGHTCASWAVDIAAKAGITVSGVENMLLTAPKFIEWASHSPTAQFQNQLAEM